MTNFEPEVIMPENFLEPRRYRYGFQCDRCGHKWKTGPLLHAPKKDPPCPKLECKIAAANEALVRENANLQAMLASGHPPAHIGANNTVKAVDATAEIVMQDYGMTNLQDNIRMGDSVSPKLPVEQQKQADNYFGPKGAIPVTVPQGERRATMGGRQMEALGRRAMAGAFRNMAVPPTAIMPDAVAGQKPLTQVGSKANDLYRGPRSN